MLTLGWSWGALRADRPVRQAAGHIPAMPSRWGGGGKRGAPSPAPMFTQSERRCDLSMPRNTPVPGSTNDGNIVAAVANGIDQNARPLNWKSRIRPTSFLPQWTTDQCRLRPSLPSIGPRSYLRPDRATLSSRWVASVLRPHGKDRRFLPFAL